MSLQIATQGGHAYDVHGVTERGNYLVMKTFNRKRIESIVHKDDVVLESYGTECEDPTHGFSVELEFERLWFKETGQSYAPSPSVVRNALSNSSEYTQRNLFEILATMIEDSE